MSKQQTDLPERLRTMGATSLEQRLLEAAGRERPSRELSERMAQAIGVSFSVPGGTSGGANTGTATGTAAKASSTLVPWLSAAVVAACFAAGAYVVTRAAVKPAAPLSTALPAQSAASAPSALVSPAPASTPAEARSPSAAEELPARSAVPQRGRRGTAGAELAPQIALVDAARSALSAGNAARALSIVRDYQSQYPSGTFRPEVAAVKIEALVKLGRTAEARTLAERFVVAYGPSPLAERVARLAQLAEP